MSRIGKHPVPVPSGVQVTLGDGSLAVTAPFLPANIMSILLSLTVRCVQLHLNNLLLLFLDNYFYQLRIRFSGH